MHAQHIAKPSDAYPVTPFPSERRAAMRKTRFWAAIAVAALLLVGIAGWANTNANTNNLALEFQGPGIDPLQIMMNAKNLPTLELEGVHGL
jgi:hypothetical protein